MQHAACNTQHATRSMQHATFSMQCAARSTQHAPRNMLCTCCCDGPRHLTGSVQRAACSVQHVQHAACAACSVQHAACAACSVQHAAHCMLHAARCMPHAACSVHGCFELRGAADTSLPPAAAFARAFRTFFAARLRRIGSAMQRAQKNSPSGGWSTICERRTRRSIPGC